MLEVLDRRLAEEAFLAGEYGIANIANFAWARTHAWSGVDVEGLDHLHRWIEKIEARPAVKRGLEVPPSQPSTTTEKKSKGIRGILA